MRRFRVDVFSRRSVTLLGFRNPVRRISHAARLLSRRPRFPKTGGRCSVVGHRGASRFEAENTIPSFAKALELGADGIETDVCVTLNGHFVLWHDCHPDFVWTVNEEKRLRELVGLGVDGILTDDPALLRRIVESR